MGVLPSIMALKAVLVLATIGFVHSQSHCSAFEDGTNDGRDCSCADRSFRGCSEPESDAQFPVLNLEECQALCKAWSRCGWFIFERYGSEHLNCNANFCPGGCASCAGDRCNDFAETGCAKPPPETVITTASDALECQLWMTKGFNEVVNYFTFDNPRGS